MRLLIVRHGDPDYEHDDLTEKGQREALLLRDRLVKEDITAFYQSPLGRAQATARPTLAATGQTAVTCDWLREFDGYAVDQKTGQPSLAWDKLPSFVAADPAYYDPDKWIETPYYSSGTVAEKYRAVCAGLDELLAQAAEHSARQTQASSGSFTGLLAGAALAAVLLFGLLRVKPWKKLRKTAAAKPGGGVEFPILQWDGETTRMDSSIYRMPGRSGANGRGRQRK